MREVCTITEQNQILGHPLCRFNVYVRELAAQWTGALQGQSHPADTATTVGREGKESRP